MTEEEVHRLRKGDRVYSEQMGFGRVREVWAFSLVVFISFDDGGACYYPRDQYHYLEQEADVLARREIQPRCRPSGLALKLAC